MAMSPIGIRPDGGFQYGNVQVEIDEALLKEIAAKTGGQYFRATSTTKLEQIYEEINKLEKTDIEEFKYTQYDEMFRPWAIFALILIGFEFLLRVTVFRGFL
jgi:Ca-activated chloride channel family protein